MVIKSQENSFGAWVCLIGVILAIIAGIFTTLIPVESIIDYTGQVYGVLIILGILMGFFIRFTDKDAKTFLLVGVVLVVVSQFGINTVSGSLMGLGIAETVVSIFRALLTLFVPATIIVALRSLFSIANV